MLISESSGSRGIQDDRGGATLGDADPDAHPTYTPRRAPRTTVATAPVSVIVPAYGHAGYILASIESVLSQPTPPREVIVIDDSSPDDTAERLAPLARDGRIRYVRQPNAGMAAARNVGAKLATSEYLYFLDDDDLMVPGALTWLAEELDRHPEAAMAFGDMVIFSGEPPETMDAWAASRDVDRVPFMLFNQLGSPGQVLIRRSAFHAVGGFDAGIWGTDDWDLWLRLLERFPARSARRPVVAYRLHANNASRNVARMYQSSLHTARRGLRGFPASRRAALRRYTFLRLRQYHAPRLVEMLKATLRRRQWRLAFAAARAWVTAWVTEGLAAVALKAYLVRRGRWRLPANEPVTRSIADHCNA